MKLTMWAKQQGVSYTTAWRWWKAGKLPVASEQMASGTIIVHAHGHAQGVAIYARVSSADQKADLDRQIVRLTEHAMREHMVVVDVIREIGSGLNGHRPALLRLLRNTEMRTILVEHRDRLLRFGFDYIEAALAAQERRILVVDSAEVDDDLVRDVTEVMTSLCARLYGKRSATNRARRALAAMRSENTVSATPKETC